MDKAIEMEIKGLKCDNPECDYIDAEVPFDKYVVGMPCPKCGKPLLTEDDYMSSMILHTIIDNLNKFLPPTPEGAKIATAMVNMQGDGSVSFSGDVTDESIENSSIKCADCGNLEGLTMMLLLGIENKICIDCIKNEECIGKNFVEEEKKTYSEWIPIFEEINEVKVFDDDGGISVERDGKSNELLTRREAWNYFIINTVEGNFSKMKEDGLDV